MLETWLEVDTAASWNKINNAIASPAVSGYQGTGAMEGEYSISLKLNSYSYSYTLYNSFN